MKRWIAALLVLGILCVPMTGCKKRNDKKKVAICVAQNTTVDTQYLKSSLENLGYAVTVYVEKTDQQGQILQIHKLYQDNIPLVIVEPLISSSVSEILNSGDRKDTTVMFINYYGTIPENGEKICFLTGAPKGLGGAQAASFASLPDNGDLNGDGTICYAILAGAEDNEEISAQCDGIEEALFGASRLETRRCDNPTEAASVACSGLLSTYGRDLEVIVCTDANLATAAVEAVKGAGRLPGEDLYVIGAGESQAAIQLLQDGTLSALVAPERNEDGNQIVQIANDILKGNQYQTSNSFTYKTLKK